MNLLLIVIFAIIICSSVSVYRGGTISARVLSFHSTNLSIEYTMKLYWESSFSNRAFCQPATYLTCDVGGLVTTFQYQYPCPSRSNCSTLITNCLTNCYQNTSDYYYGVKKYNKTFYAGTLGIFIATFAGRSQDVRWVQLDGGGSTGIWRQRIRYDTNIISKYGNINQTPRVLMPNHLIKVPSGVNSRIPIGYVDFDGDIVRCRWSTNSSEECGGVCQNSPDPPLNKNGSSFDQAVPFADLKSNECFLDLNLFNTSITGRFAVAIQIEDFDSAASLNPLSSVPYQFLIEVTDVILKDCSFQPRYVNSFPQCQVISTGERWFQIIQVFSNCSSIIKIDIIGLENASVNKINTSFYSVSWLPMQDDFGSYRVCIVASDNFSNSNFQCLTLHAGSTAPRIQKNESFQVDFKNDSLYNWVLEFSQPVDRSIQYSLIRFFSADDKLIFVVNSSQLDFFERNRKTSFNTNFSFIAGDYYVLFDAGLVVGRWNCKLISEEVKNTRHWSFTIKGGQEALEIKQDQIGLIVGVIVGIIVLVLLIGVILYLKICQKRVFKVN